MAERQRTRARTIWLRMSAPFVQAVLAGHSSLGLAFAALIYLVCFSGTVAVLVHDFERWGSRELFGCCGFNRFLHFGGCEALSGHFD